MNLVIVVLSAQMCFAQDTGQPVSAGPEPLAKGRLFLSTDMLGYMNNLEYFNNYREGNFYLGTNLSVRTLYRPNSALTFGLGVFARKAVADEKFFSDIRPLFKARFQRGVFALTIGELDWKDRHGLPDAVMREQYDYEKGVEEGFQLQWNWPAVGWDLWAAYDSLNTARHREHLRFGSVTKLELDPVHLAAFGHWDHYGGQNFAPPGDPVRDNWIGGVRMGGTVVGTGLLDEVGVEETAMGSATTADRNRIDFATGWGLITRAWVTLNGFELMGQYYRSNGFETWQGNSMYRSKGPYCFVQVSRLREFDRGLLLDWGLRADFVEVTPREYLDHLEHQVWVTIGWSLDRLIY